MNFHQIWFVHWYYGDLVSDCWWANFVKFWQLSARVTPIFSFPDDNLSKHQWIFTKLSVCIDIVEICFDIANGQILHLSLSVSDFWINSLFMPPTAEGSSEAYSILPWWYVRICLCHVRNQSLTNVKVYIKRRVPNLHTHGFASNFAHYLHKAQQLYPATQ